MKGFNILCAIVALFFSEASMSQVTENKTDYLSFGKQITMEGAGTSLEASEVYQNLKIKDTISTKFSAKVTDVCQAKGCWMKLSLEDGKETMVRFKDYGFFMPMNIVGQEVVVNGLAFVEEMSVADQKHFAKDGGASEEEINKITDVKKTFGFEADGVLIKQ
ncbi:hypothetical protein GGR42_002990 [Saonia flava]|uniref:DUF4920 domain-containing protein n=1 Tax=Saonia flava TaxID=523696 RepID=A0A846R6U9_9FLAO|nr:DUF4920 domain-containing protein [Saonia flava]NJB72499.1 hypothetical protein [Saonia flava]